MRWALCVNVKNGLEAYFYILKFVVLTENLFICILYMGVLAMYMSASRLDEQYVICPVLCGNRLPYDVMRLCINRI